MTMHNKAFDKLGGISMRHVKCGDGIRPFRIYGSGIYSLRQPRYCTAKEANDDLWRYANSLQQSPLIFTVYEDLPDGTFRLA